MAALSETPLPRVMEMRQLRAEDLEATLEEEIVTWRERLSWDFRSSADLVRRFVQMQALSGYGLVIGNRVVGYAYYVCEERKGLVGDLYVMQQHRSIEYENLLLGPVLDDLRQTPFIRRVESQLMMLSSPLARQLPLGRKAQMFPRNFMEAPLAEAPALPARAQPGRLRFEPWSERNQDEAARVIASAYEGHVDSRVNDQYRSIPGARRFLLNIVQYPGCGMFFQPGSFVAADEAKGHLSGICLASLVSEDVGHITQICVTPDVRGTGAGYELLRRSMNALLEYGCRKASLTVTSSNTGAIELYERVGFRTVDRFAAYVWEGF
jgi:ribosomal protein S18 acetylase RimI-like enzyme